MNTLPVNPCPTCASLNCKRWLRHIISGVIGFFMAAALLMLIWPAIQEVIASVIHIRIADSISYKTALIIICTVRVIR